MSKNIRIVTLTPDDTLSGGTHDAILETVLTCISLGWKCQPKRMMTNNISRTRGAALSDFHESDCTDLVFLDSDVRPEPGALIALLSQPADLCAAVGPMKTKPVTWPVRYLQDRPELIADPVTGLLEVEGVGAAVMRITRACAARMIEAHGDWEYPSFETASGRAWDVFATICDEAGLWSEDYSFCRRWRALGGQVWIDPTIGVEHVGRKVYSGCIGDWLKARAMEPKVLTFEHAA